MRKHCLILIALLSVLTSWKKGADPRPDLRAQLEKLKEVFIATTIEDKVDERMKYYAPDAISMPEYHPLVQGVSLIKKYYTEIFKRQQVKSYTKEITEVIDLGGTVAEYGIFKIEYSTASEGSVVHTGKYCNIWEVQAGGSLLLEAEGWGYFRHIENPNSLYVETAVSDAETDVLPGDDKSADILFELRALNTLMEKMVQKRDGRSQADFYAVDGTYMPFADTTKTGRDGIRRHLINYTSGGGIVLDSINIHTYQLKSVGNYVIEYSKFYVKWTTDRTGKTKGKGIRIWKRTPAGSLKLYRQMGMHDVIID